MVARSNYGSGGAYFEINGEIANNSTWQENIYFTEAGVGMDLTGLAFKMTFRKDPEATSADYTLSTADGTLSIETNPDSSIDNILYINVPAGSLNSLLGDYVTDLASQDSNDVVTPWGHGIVTFRPNPVSFS